MCLRWVMKWRWKGCQAGRCPSPVISFATPQSSSGVDARGSKEWPGPSQRGIGAPGYGVGNGVYGTMPTLKGTGDPPGGLTVVRLRGAAGSEEAVE